MADNLNGHPMVEFSGATHYPYSLRAVIIGALVGMPSAALLLLLSLPVNAEMLPDPTRPSPGYDALQDHSAEDGPVLQSIMISPGRKSVIISGVKVDLGGKYAEAKLIRVSEGEAVLQRNGVLQTLKLFPGVEKRVPKVAKVVIKPVQKSGKKTYDK